MKNHSADNTIKINMIVMDICFVQLIDIVGSVLERPLIRNEFTAKYVEIIVMLKQELDICEVSV